MPDFEEALEKFRDQWLLKNMEIGLAGERLFFESMFDKIVEAFEEALSELECKGRK